MKDEKVALQVQSKTNSDKNGEPLFLKPFIEGVTYTHNQRALEVVKKWNEKKVLTSFPYHVVVSAYHEVGKHFVTQELLIQLNQVREELIELEDIEYQKVITFLDVMLDKYDEVYDYRTYLALNLLNLAKTESVNCYPTGAQNVIDDVVCLLIVDILEYELSALEGDSWLPMLPADEKLVTKRCLLALKALKPYLERSHLACNLDLNAPIESARYLIDSVDYRMSGGERRMLHSSILPVYLVHDEYMFIRVLQSFESVFSWMILELTAAIKAFSSDSARVIEHMGNCEKMLSEAVLFFQLLTTMRPEAFKVFREYTDGASAIQSRSYKKVESLCRLPDEDRLNSLAYDSVPDVKERLLKGHANLDDAYHFVFTNEVFSPEQLEDIKQAMDRFAAKMVRWRQSHYGIAMTMLGMEKGTGNTKGTPYLKEVRKIPIFKATKELTGEKCCD
jgi:tryptophan 2,3-dioxygenase